MCARGAASRRNVGRSVPDLLGHASFLLPQDKKNVSKAEATRASGSSGRVSGRENCNCNIISRLNIRQFDMTFLALLVELLKQ